MDKTKKIALGIGLVLAVLVAFTASVAADGTARFDPQHGNGTTGEWVKVVYYVDIESGENVAAAQQTIKFNPDIITVGVVTVEHDCGAAPPTGEGQYCWGAFDHNDTYLPNGYSWSFNGDPRISEWHGPPDYPPPGQWVWESLIGEGFDHTNTDGTIEIATYWVRPQPGDIPGVSPFDFGSEQFPPGCLICQHTGVANWTPQELPMILVNGTFTHDYVISGYTNPVATRVNITNLNKPDAVDDKPAEINLTTGFYNLALNMSSEVEDGDELQIIACQDLENNESKCNVSTHIVAAPGHESNVNLTLNHFCRNPETYPYRTWNASNWSGPAAMEMMIDHYLNPPWVPNQTVLNETGIGYNQECNNDSQFVDPRGMKYALNQYLHWPGNPDPYVAHYGIGSYTDINDTLHYMCKWHYLGPGAAPAYGDYSNWMVVRGIHTDVEPTFTQGSYKIYGFWMNDPYNATMEGPGGIGENTYKSVEQWKSMYHKMLIVDDEDQYNGTYVAVCEPPEDDDVVVTLAHAKPRLAEPITPMLAEEPMMLYGIEQLALEKVVRDDELLKIVKAAIDGVNEELVPYDDNFAAVFAKTVPGKPKLVTSDNGDYYVVPFNVPVVERLPVKRMPVEIERPKMSGLRKLVRVKRVAANAVIEPIVIEPIKVERTLVVVLVNAEDGSFKEASWVADPVEYLPVSKIEAMKLAVGEVLDELHVVAKKDARDLEVVRQRPTIELVYTDASPYYPDWKVTVNGKVFYVSQDGTVSS